MADIREKTFTPKTLTPGGRLIRLVIPLLLLGGLVAAFLVIGPRGIFPGEFPPVEDLSFGRVTLAPNEIKMVVTNGGPSPVTIAQVLVDDAYWEHEVVPGRTVERLGSATITIPYPWVEGEPAVITIITETGVTFTHEIAVATSTPPVDMQFLVTFAVLGIYIGVIPVALGMTWRPFLLTLSDRWIHFFMALTAGILIFIGVETFVEALENSEGLPSAFGSTGLVTVVALASFLVILLGSRRIRGIGPSRGRSGLAVAYAVATGIGLHNLGEGLAVGAAYRLGEIALGAFLVIGFALHNTTEGIGIVSILGRKGTNFKHLIALGAVAGVPTIFGAWTGAFFFSPVIATVFLAIAAGAIAEVVVDVMRVVRDDAVGGLMSTESLAGVVTGLAVMYLTGLLIAA